MKYNSYNIMFFHIPCASREQKPVFRTTNPYNGTFKRNYEGDYKCTEKEVQRMFADANEWVSLDHIATVIDRNSDYLLTSVISSMLEEGLLERMYPQIPKHPYQKYKRK